MKDPSIVPMLLVACAGCCTQLASAEAQWTPPYWQLYRLGYTDAEHTSAGGEQRTSVRQTSGSTVIGTSERYGGGGGTSAWTWNPSEGLTQLGLFSPEHVRSDGQRKSFVVGVNPNGRVIGSSTRYSGASERGSSAWTWTRATNAVQLGLVDTEHTSTDGHRFSQARSIRGNTVVGTSSRYSASGQSGASAWAWEPSLGTIRIGFVGPEYTRSDGLQSSSVGAATGGKTINGNGRVLGSSDRFAGDSNGSPIAWTWTRESGTIELGFTDADHTSPTGSRTSRARSMNDAGQIVGWSSRRTPGGGDSAWIWSDATGPVRIGLVDSVHTGRDGRQESRAQFLNGAGMTAGWSTRPGAPGKGRSAWVWTEESGSLRIGLIDAEHTGASGTQFSTPTGISESGQVVGYSKQGQFGNGRSVWAWDRESGVHRAGLTDALHTGADGRRVSLLHARNEAGHLAGLSFRYGDAVNGTSAWTWSMERDTVQIGLYDDRHTRGDGITSSDVNKMNVGGDVIGISERYNGATSLGRSGWFYEYATDITHALTFSESPRGDAYTDPSFVTSSGWVLGQYDLYAGDGLVSRNGFIWSVSEGFADLGSLVEGGLSAAGWESLGEVVSASEYRMIVGFGDVIGTSGTAAFALTMGTIPAPSALLFMGAGVLAHGRRRPISS
ncbi:MAG: hypothetical protein KF912_07120 [Phycisphaeraceae bacterium]|nr:hypothetical protein [Phycisphaeraceae bacterium]MBX3367072.1 hypothetical protein [Phycisphaeraceae bacterium]